MHVHSYNCAFIFLVEIDLFFPCSILWLITSDHLLGVVDQDHDLVDDQSVEVAQNLQADLLVEVVVPAEAGPEAEANLVLVDGKFKSEYY